MSLKCAMWVFVAMWVVTSQAVDSSRAFTNRTSKVFTNKTSKTVTNQMTKISTNQPPQIATNVVVTAPQVPGDKYTNGVGMHLLKMPGGYWAGEYEVTQKEYQKVMESNPSSFGGETRPVDNVSWTDAMAFCDKLTEDELKSNKLPDGFYYALPTEAQWESMLADRSEERRVGKE